MNVTGAALFSIKPEHVQKLRTGEKLFEFRRKLGGKIAGGSIDLIAVYETVPTGQIVGIMNVNSILRAPLSALWMQTWERSGITFAEFSEYFKGLESGYAIEISKYRELWLTVYPPEIGIDRPPQNYQYLDSEQLAYLLRQVEL